MAERVYRATLLVAALLAACDGAGPGELGEVRAAVVDGTTSPDALGFGIDALQRNAVVGLLYSGTEQGCTGTLIGDRLVVSAAHCVVSNLDQWEQGAAPVAIRPSTLSIAVGEDVTQACSLAVQAILVHPEAQVAPDGSIAHDVSLILLSRSALAQCPEVVPVQLNLEPIPAGLVGQRLLQGGFGSLDFSYSFSKTRRWSLQVLTAFAPDYVATTCDGHGGPSYGDSGSGLLHRFPDGSLRTLAVDSLGFGLMSTFVRLDAQAPFFVENLAPELVCGTVTEAGVCKGSLRVACGERGFTTLDCAATNQACLVDAVGTASCRCACDSDASCQPDCACDSDCACPCNSSGGCEAGCACDPQCEGWQPVSGCACDATSGCDVGCACDPQCGPEWAPLAGCACDATPGCEQGCGCDPACECVEVPQTGCATAPGGAGSIGSGVALALLATAVLRRRRAGGALLLLVMATGMSLQGCGEEEATLRCTAREDGGIGFAVDASVADAGSASGTDASGSMEADASTSPPDASHPDATGCAIPQDLIDADACGAGMACDVVDFVAGSVGCRPAGTTEPYAACAPGTSPCMPGSMCFGFTSKRLECTPFCDAAQPACPGVGRCLSIGVVPTTDVGVCVRPSNCSLIPPTGCSMGEGCYLESSADGATFCVPTRGLGDGAPCEAPNTCRAGFTCASGACRRWCRTAADCVSPGACTQVGELSAFHPDLGVCL